MAETVKPPKRRRILDPSAIVSVPIYSSQVSNNLQLRAPVFSESKATDEDTEADDWLWPRFSRETKAKSPLTVTLSDSEDEAETETRKVQPLSQENPLRSPSPPPPESPVQKPSRKASRKLREVERRLQSVNSLLSPADDSRRRRRGRGRRSPRLRDEVVVLSDTNEDDEDDEEEEDVVVLDQDSELTASDRQIPLKVRCRTDLHRIPVQPSTRLSAVVEQLSVKLGVPPPRLLLLRQEAELSRDSTIRELGLGIADILECVVMAEAEEATPTAADTSDVITVRLQGKDRSMSQEFSLCRDAPLGSVFAQFSSRLPSVAQKKASFHFDGSRVSPEQTPQQLDMEDGDIIEVWA